MGLGKWGNTMVHGVLGTMSEVDLETLQKKYSAYLMEDETILTGFKLIRDTMIITDRRIIDFDKQGATGQKMTVDSIYLDSIYQVSIETAGFGIDDSQLTIHYITTPNMKAHAIQCASKSYEFPKKYNIQGLYTKLQELAYKTFLRLNS